MKFKLTLLLLLLCIAVKAQTVSPDNRIVVLGEASINVPADQAKFTVILESTDSTSIERVHQKHKLLEGRIVKLLQDLQLPDSAISYSLFSVHKTQNYIDRNRVSYFVGRQSVSFTLSTIDRLPEVQERLIKDGFSNFNSHFTSTQLHQHQAQALEKAIQVAKDKANIMASAAGRKIKRIVKVADTEDTDPVFINFSRGNGPLYEKVEIGYGAANLTNFAQTIPVTASVKVVFELK